MMKMKSLILTSVLASTLALAPFVFGQGAEDLGKWRKHHEEHLANLSPDERQKLEAAHQKAMQDPAVHSAHEKMRQAHKEFRDALHAAMLKADPTVQPILDKMSKDKKGDR
jgi:uncharacterized protein YbaA (DUF1428 family)